ncbi:hypothetical protein M9Y10_034782 [Tritrichomonas musculus]|uniref:ubiquitinyl hydrolase 1 n=1 Tax=Tritrichomonas musculus TaxID=1915356 RepID=A0ABR2KGD9_9EUKA
MNDENEKQEEPDPAVVLKHELRARKEELQRPEPRQKSQYVALVERNWYKSMVQWMNTKHGEFPGPIPNQILCKDGKLDPQKRYGRDFAVVSVSIFDRLVSFFKGGPKIVRPYAIIPGTDKPQFIMEPFTLNIIVDNKTLRKVVDPKWKIGPIRAQLCSSLKISRGKSRLRLKDKDEVVDDDLCISEVITPESSILVFDIDPEGRGIEYTRFKTFEDSPIHIFSTPDKSSAFLVCIECLMNIAPLTDFVLAEGFENQINHDNKRGSGGAIAHQFLKLARARMTERNNETNATIDANPLKIALVEKYPELLEFGHFDPQATLAALLDGLFEDTNRGQAIEDGSPIADIFLGTLRGNLECPLCQNFEDIKERFLFLLLNIPDEIRGQDATLQDCIAHFSVGEVIPESNRIQCKFCKKLVRAYRTVAVDICPEVLIIPFKRLGGIGSLTSFITTPVSYPDELDIGSFASSSSGIYRLFAVIFHQGLIDDNKYSCACLDQKTGKWTYITKDKALIVDESGAHSGDALILFYQRVKKK